MIDGLRPYADMKQSGVDWLPNLPSGWEIHRAKYSFKQVDDRSEDGDEELLSVSHKTGVTSRSEKKITMFMAESYEKHKVCRPGDVVVNTMWAWMAAIGVSRQVGIVSPAYGVYRPRSVERFEPKFLDYLLRTEIYRAEYLRSSRGITTSRLRLYPPDFLNIPFVQPPLDEQRLIVRFLDWHGAQTAKLIRAKKKIIALLNEQKQAIIHRALTRGLDPKVRLKPSGIAWLGELPEGWGVISVGAASTFIQTGPFGSQLPASAYISGGVPVINPSHLVNGRIEGEDQVSVSEEVATRLQRHRFSVGDLAIARRGEIGRCSIVTDREAGWVCGTGTIRLAPKNGVVSAEFLALLLGDPLLRADLKSASIGATMDNLNEGMVGRLQIPLPPFSQQFSIVAFASEVASSSGQAAHIVEREVSLIQEFRTRMIADVVAGKLDVRAAAATIPEGIEPEAIDELIEDDFHEAPCETDQEEVAA